MQSLGDSRAGERREGASGGENSVLRSLTWSNPEQWSGPTMASALRLRNIVILSVPIKNVID